MHSFCSLNQLGAHISTPPPPPTSGCDAALNLGGGEGHCESKVSYSRTQHNVPGAHFSKAQETFQARKATFSSSVSTLCINGEVYML